MYTFLIIGKHFSDLRLKLAEDNYRGILLLDSSIPPPSYLDKVEYIRCDFSSEGKILNILKEVKGQLKGVINLYEQYVLPAAFIAKILELPGVPLTAAEACSDKLIMRSLLADAPQSISPNFTEVLEEGNLQDFGQKYGFPIIIKPAHLSKSLLVSKCQTQKEALEAYKWMRSEIDKVYKQYAPHRKPKIIAEEFMVGPIFAADAFTDNHGQVKMIDALTDILTGQDIGYEDNFLYSRVFPSALSQGEKQKLLDTAQLGIETLGIKNSAVHVQMIATKNGPKIVEIAARIGGYRAKMHRLAHGIDMMEAILATAAGQPVNLVKTKEEPCVAIELFPRQAGIFKSIQNQDRLVNLPSLKYFIIKQPFGKWVGKSHDGYKMCAIIILHNKDRDQFARDLDFVNNYVQVVTDQIEAK